MVLGGEHDQDHIDRVYATIWPTRDREADARGDSKGGRNRFRDALQVANAIRYTGTGFVTRDTDLLKAAERVKLSYNGFLLVPIADATSRSMDAARALRSTAAKIGDPDPGSLPNWPT